MSIPDELSTFSEDINDFDDILPNSVDCGPDPSSQFAMSKNTNSARQSDSWKRVISNIVEGYLEYLTKTLSKPMTSPASTISYYNQSCKSRKFMLLCLFFDHKLLFHVSQFKLHPKHTRLFYSQCSHVSVLDTSAGPHSSWSFPDRTIPAVNHSLH